MGVRDRLALLRKVFGPTDPAAFAAGEVAAGMTPSSPFSPGEPIGPYDGYSRTPRARDFVTGYNIASRPRTHERVSFDTLKGLVDAYDVAQMCIWHRIDSIRAMDWALVPYRGFKGDADAAIDLGMAALEKPDRQNPFASWLALWLYDVLAFDAGTLYRIRNRRGDAIGLRVVDGTSIAPLLDYWGNSPEPPAEAYVQYVQGLAWNWLTRDDIIYQPFRPVPGSPYGRAPLESVLLNANTDLRFQAYFLQRFTEGNIPEAFASAPETWSPNQIEQFQEYWDAFMLGDQSMKHQIRWIPGGSSIAWSNEKDFSDSFSLFLMRKTASAFHVPPADLGFTENVNRSSGETQADVQHRVGDRPLLTYVEGVLTGFLRHDLNLPLEFTFDTGREKEDRLAEAQAWQVYINNGMASVDEGREQLLGLPSDPHRPTPRFVMTSQGPMPIVAVDGTAGKVDPETYGPARDQPNITPPPPAPAAPGKAPAEAPAHEARPSAAKPEQAAPVAKDGEAVAAPTAGITTATGIDGYDLVGHDLHGEDEDDEERDRQELAKREVVAFRRFRQARRRAGTWRDFEFHHIDPVQAHRLNNAGRLAVRKAAGEVAVAGLAVRAADTGRVLMLQRALDDDDPAAGCWEFPGGHLEDGETPLRGAWREWSEEVGLVPPPGEQTGTWLSPNGVYQGIVWTVPSESYVPVHEGRDAITNPDDPDGDMVEAVAWWNPGQLAGNPAVRPELLDALDLVMGALGGDALVKSTAVERARIIAPVQQRIVDGLQRLADGLADGSVPAATFVDQAADILRNGIREGMTLGTRHADTAVVTKLSDEFEEWRAAFDARFAQYANTAATAFDEGQALSNLSKLGDWLIRWDAKPGACDLCTERNGNTYKPGTLPGLPGMGGFGDVATVCRGGPNCRCGITYLRPGDVGREAQPTTPTSPTSPAGGRHRAVPAPVAEFQQQMSSNIQTARALRQAGHVDPTSGPYADLLDRIADQRANQQRTFLQGLLQDLLAALARVREGVKRHLNLGGSASATAAVDTAGTMLGDAADSQASVAKEYDPTEARDDHGRWSHLGAVEHAIGELSHDEHRSDRHTSAEQTWPEVEADCGDTLDMVDFGDGASVNAHTDGVVSITFPGEEKNHWAVLAAMSTDDARRLAQDLEWALDINPDSDDYEGGADPDNGLIDWVTDQDGGIVGVDPAGDIRIGVPDGRGRLDEVDISPEDAQHLVDGLRDMADAADEPPEDD